MSAISAITSAPVSLPPASNVPPQTQADDNATNDASSSTVAIDNALSAPAQTPSSDQDAAAQSSAPSSGGYTAVASASASTIRGSNLNVVT